MKLTMFRPQHHICVTTSKQRVKQTLWYPLKVSQWTENRISCPDVYGIFHCRINYIFQFFSVPLDSFVCKRSLSPCFSSALSRGTYSFCILPWTFFLLWFRFIVLQQCSKAIWRHDTNCWRCITSDDIFASYCRCYRLKNIRRGDSRISEEEVSIGNDYTKPLFYAQADFLQKLA